MSRANILTIAVLAGALTLVTTKAHAAAPQVIPLQGLLTDSGGNPLNGDHTMQFNLYADATPSATSLWSETQTVSVVDGLFVAYLGTTQAVPLALMRDNGDLWLGITVESDPEMPRVYLGTTPFAAYAEYCGNIPAHGHDYGELTGTLSTAALPGEVVSGPQACLGSDKVTGFDGTGAAICGPDQDNDTTYSGLDFAISGQFCPPADRMAGIDGGGNIACAPDSDTQYTGADFAISAQNCGAGEVATGIGPAGALICTPLDFARDNQTCPPGEVATGFDASGALICTPQNTYTNVDFAPSNQTCPPGQVATGIDAAGSLTCAPGVVINCAASQIARHDGTGWVCTDVPAADCGANEFLSWQGGAFVCKSRGCPAGMADAGGFCIDVDDNPATNWQAQANLCQQEGKRLCSLGEWISACNDRTALGLNNMLDGSFEYVDEYWVMHYQTSGGYYQSYVSAGATACGRIYYSGWGCGASTCYDTTHAGGSYQSRCCK